LKSATWSPDRGTPGAQHDAIVASILAQADQQPAAGHVVSANEQARDPMSIFKRFVRSTGFIATLTADLLLLAATDGARARDGGGRLGSEEAREGGPSPTANPIRNTIHPIIYKPGGDHKSDRCHKHDRCHAHIRFLGPPVPVPVYPAKPAPVASDGKQGIVR
jgi:hypothetical protein